jgi:hypothetical protein
MLADGLRKNERLPRPILTPRTKLEEHDRNVSRAETIGDGLISDALSDRIATISFELFARGTEVASERGLIQCVAPIRHVWSHSSLLASGYPWLSGASASSGSGDPTARQSTYRLPCKAELMLHCPLCRFVTLARNEVVRGRGQPERGSDQS